MRFTTASTLAIGVNSVAFLVAEPRRTLQYSIHFPRQDKRSLPGNKMPLWEERTTDRMGDLFDEGRECDLDVGIWVVMRTKSASRVIRQIEEEDAVLELLLR
jgi:hypothetical protein